MPRTTHRRTAKSTQSLVLVWWVFKLNTGEITKHYGNDLRDCGDTFEVWNDHAYIGAVSKDQIADRWAQDREFTDRETR